MWSELSRKRLTQVERQAPSLVRLRVQVRTETCNILYIAHTELSGLD